MRIWLGLAAGDETGCKRLLLFRLKDTGCGLSPEQQARLSIPFSQADSSVTRRFGGTGLGLALSRTFAEELGGGVVLRKSLPGSGSTFELTLDPGLPADVKLLHGLTMPDLEDPKHMIRDWFKDNRRLSGITVLLVEDGPDNQLISEHFLNASGAHVDLATDGNEDVEKARAGKYDLVLMDIQMPVLDR